MRKIGIVLLLITALLAGIVAGCSDDKSDEQTFCESLQALDEAVQNVKSITTETDEAQVEEYKTQLKSAWDDTVKAGEKITSNKFDELATAYDELNSSLDGIFGAVPITEVLPTIKAAVTQFLTTLDEMESTDCSSYIK